MGDFAEGLAIDRNPEFESWLGTQRRQFRELHVAMLERLVELAPDQSSDAFRYLEKWLQLAPFDVRPHELLLNSLLRAGRVREAEDHFSSTTHQYEAEGLDWLPIREVWKAARHRASNAPIESHVIVLSGIPARSRRRAPTGIASPRLRTPIGIVFARP